MNNRITQCSLALTFIFASMAPGTIYAAHDAVRPMGGSCVTQFQFTTPTTVYLTGTCHFLHLGLTSVVATQTAIFNAAEGRFDIINDALYTAANGDQLRSVTLAFGFPITGTSEVQLVGTETYTGGTGRFEDATGSAQLNGMATFTSAAGGTGGFTTQGTITY